jgi:hypothetical protein
MVITENVEVIGTRVSRMSWSAIFAGTVAALGVWALLYVLGLAAGLSAIDPSEPGSVRSAGIGTGIWTVIVPLLALFVGGVVVGRLDGSVDRTDGALHGLVLWGFTTVVGVAVMGAMLGGLLSGAGRLGQAGASAAAGAGSLGDDAMSALGISERDLLAPINARLGAAGRPTVTPEQLSAALQDAVRESVRQGRFDRSIVVSALVERTPLERGEAEQIAANIEQRWSDFRSRGLAQAQSGVLQAADKTGKVLWGVFAALLLGLISAVAGSLLGVPRGPRRLATTTVMRPGEVHP